MSLLDDARRLIEPAVEGAYVYCGGLVDEGHREQCKLAAVPAIVAALEAAERLIADGPPMHADASPYPFRCVYCLARDRGTLSSGPRVDHKGSCPYGGLLVALEDSKEVKP